MMTRVAVKPLFIGLILLLITSCILSLKIGAIPVSFNEIWQSIFSTNLKPSQESSIIWQLRMPRTLLGCFVGAILAICGVAMQGLFRNPLADPGLIGVSSGAALGAGLAIVFGGGLIASTAFESYALAIFAFIGGLLVTWIVYKLGQRNGTTDVSTMLLAGIAITALSGSGIGLLMNIADDTMLRRLTFWNMGTLNGAMYSNIWPLLIVTIIICLFLPFRANGLNALLLGESEARHLGVNVERLKIELVICTALGVGAAVAAAGMIGFVGLVVPHLMRLLVGPNHKLLLPASAIAGASLLVLADIIARVIFSPAELQIGIVTAFLGAPFFLYLLMRRKY